MDDQNRHHHIGKLVLWENHEEKMEFLINGADPFDYPYRKISWTSVSHDKLSFHAASSAQFQMDKRLTY